jgi:hypothetical protein
MYSACEKQIDWSNGMLLALRWEDYGAYMCITSHHSWCYSGNIPRAISIDPPFPPWVPPSNLASRLPPTSSCSESIVKSKGDVEPKESIRLNKDVSRDSVTDKDIKEVPSISTSLLEIPTTILPNKEDANGVLNIIGEVSLRELGIHGKLQSSQSDESTFLDDVYCGSPTPVIPSWAPGLFSRCILMGKFAWFFLILQAIL